MPTLLHKQAATRDATIRGYVDAAVDQGLTTWDGYVDTLRQIYWRDTPARVRTFEFRDPETDPEPARAMAANTAKVMDWFNPRRTVRMPVELEEAAVFALPESIRERCQQDLARRLGCYGALKRPVDPAGECATESLIGGDYGELLGVVARMKANGGEINRDDRAQMPDLEAAVDRMQADVEALRRYCREATGSIRSVN